MSIEDRISFLLKAASRAEGEGESRVARTLRRMADEARPPLSAVQLSSGHAVSTCD